MDDSWWVIVQDPVVSFIYIALYRIIWLFARTMNAERWRIHEMPIVPVYSSETNGRIRLLQACPSRCEIKQWKTAWYLGTPASNEQRLDSPRWETSEVVCWTLTQPWERRVRAGSVRLDVYFEEANAYEPTINAIINKRNQRTKRIRVGCGFE